MPVIYITGNDEPDVREAAVASGCMAFLTKPFSRAVAHRAAQEGIVRGWRSGRPSVDLGQRQRSFGAHAMFSRT